MKGRARFSHLASRSLSDSEWSREEALEVMHTSDEDIPDLLWAGEKK